jgi:hypothetical protein
VFYGRVSTEDWQDPVTSRARQRDQAGALVCGHGVIVAEFFDAGESRTVAWGRRPQAAALVAQLADLGRGWDAIVIGEYERAFYGAQYRATAAVSGSSASRMLRGFVSPLIAVRSRGLPAAGCLPRCSWRSGGGRFRHRSCRRPAAPGVHALDACRWRSRGCPSVW